MYIYVLPLAVSQLINKTTQGFDYGLALGRKIKNSNVEKKEQFEFSGQEKLHSIELLPLQGQTRQGTFW